jgi:hypothetical protein
MDKKKGYNVENTWEFNLEKQIRWKSDDAKDDLAYYVREFLPHIIQQELDIPIELITRIKFYRNHIKQYVTAIPSGDLLIKYFYDTDGDGSIAIQTFIVEYIKDEFPYLTGIGILESIDSLYFASKENGRLSKFK